MAIVVVKLSDRSLMAGRRIEDERRDIEQLRRSDLPSSPACFGCAR
jgi:hypothetical protein